MNKPKKCKNCQWYGKPYWSIINPCDSCPNENDYKTIIQIDGVPVIKETLTEEETISKEDLFKERIEQSKRIEELVLEIERLNNIINELEKELDISYRELFEHELVPGRELISNIQNYLKELKEGR